MPLVCFIYFFHKLFTRYLVLDVLNKFLYGVKDRPALIYLQWSTF